MNEKWSVLKQFCKEPDMVVTSVVSVLWKQAMRSWVSGQLLPYAKDKNQIQPQSTTQLFMLSCIHGPCHVIRSIFSFNTDSQVFFKMFDSNPWQQWWSSFFHFPCCSKPQYHLTEILYIWGFFFYFHFSQNEWSCFFLCMYWPLDFFCKFHIHSSVCSFSIEWLMITCSQTTPLIHKLQVSLMSVACF